MSVVDETPALGSTETLQGTLNQIQAQLQSLQKELHEAIHASHSRSESDQQQFQGELAARQKVWEQQDSDWQRDRNAYQKRIVELEEWFIKQLTVTEQNALRALNELDSSWQRDKQQWYQSLVNREKEMQGRENALTLDTERYQARIQELEAKNTELQQTVAASDGKFREQEERVEAYVHSLERELEGWKRDKEVWQQSLTERLQELHQRDEAWDAERQKTDVFIQTLQQEIARLQGLLQAKDTPATPSKAVVESNIASLESQIASLNTFIRQMFPVSGHPMRRKTDIVDNPPLKSRARD